MQSAAAAGISVHQRSLPLAQLQALLLGGSCLLIALVDKVSLLRCEAEDAAAPAAAASGGSSWAGGQRRSHRLSRGAAAAAVTAAAAGQGGGSGGGEAESVSPAASGAGVLAAAAAGSKPGGSASEGYLGHYIVVCGYDAGSQEFEIRDPAGSQ